MLLDDAKRHEQYQYLLVVCAGKRGQLQYCHFLADNKSFENQNSIFLLRYHPNSASLGYNLISRSRDLLVHMAYYMHDRILPYDYHTTACNSI